jgi:hypothetical protein
MTEFPSPGSDLLHSRRTHFHGSKVEMGVECFDRGIKSDGTLQIEALNSENVKGSTRFSATSGNNAMNSISTFTAKWIGRFCSPTSAR